VFIPLHDANPLKSIDYQYVTVAIIVLNVAIYVIFQTGWIMTPNEADTAAFAVIPAELMGHGLSLGGQSFIPIGAFRLPERFTLVSYMFLHGSWIHLLGNMLFLWVFGDNVEDSMGPIRFIMFYLMCGIFAGVLQSWMMPKSELPLIGASGAVAGIIAAYLILHPNVKVWVLALWRIPIRITASWALGIWIAAQFANLIVDNDENVAWWAHIGGLAAGALLILFMRRRGVPLFDKTRGGA
jgi:membrane associated rhomboid family serine protease